jgi:phosphohistidine phosphatase
MANLILWRHAEAEETSISGDDAERALTKRGRKDAASMAQWLQQHLPENCEILSSPARRCLQTAEALQHVSGRKTHYAVSITPFLATDGSLATMVEKLINADSSQTIVVVGHQPQLGQFIAKILGMQDSSCVVKKGAVWWLRQRQVYSGDNVGNTSAIVSSATPQLYLFAVHPPRY